MSSHINTFLDFLLSSLVKIKGFANMDELKNASKLTEQIFGQISSFKIDSERLILHRVSYLSYSSFPQLPCKRWRSASVFFFLIKTRFLPEHIYFAALIAACQFF